MHPAATPEPPFAPVPAAALSAMDHRFPDAADADGKWAAGRTPSSSFDMMSVNPESLR